MRLYIYTNKSQRELGLKWVEKMAVKLFNQMDGSDELFNQIDG